MSDDEELRPAVYSLLENLGKRRVREQSKPEDLGYSADGDIVTGQFLRTDLPIPPGGARDIAIDRVVDSLMDTGTVPEELDVLDPDNRSEMLALGTRLDLRIQGQSGRPVEGTEFFNAWHGTFKDAP